jgi:transaldolase
VAAVKFFVDTADVAEIKELATTGLLDGVTTNPSLVAKAKGDFKEMIAEICRLVPGPVSAEVAATDLDGMLQEARALARIAQNVTIKEPLTWEGTMVNVTLCFSANQALLAAKAGATFISPFVGRLDDAGQDGMELVREIRTIYDNYPDLNTQILAASIRHVIHVKQAALIGADVATVPPAVLRALVQHPLTDKGLAAFLADWKKAGQRIV